MTAYDTLLSEARGRPFAAIVGWPVELSRSPALHGFWLKQQGIDGHYGRLPVEPKHEALEELVAFLKATPNARGCNLTLPHKIDIMPLLDRIHPDAARIGAVNTVIKQADGTLEGRNSDGFGFLAHLKASAPAWKAEAGPVVFLAVTAFGAVFAVAAFFGAAFGAVAALAVAFFALDLAAAVFAVEALVGVLAGVLVEAFAVVAFVDALAGAAFLTAVFLGVDAFGAAALSGVGMPVSPFP